MPPLQLPNDPSSSGVISSLRTCLSSISISSFRTGFTNVRSRTWRQDTWKRMARGFMKSYSLKTRSQSGEEIPLRVRPSFAILTLLTLLLLALFGFHPTAASAVPVPDKVLHFFCFFLATMLFWWMWDVDLDGFYEDDIEAGGGPVRGRRVKMTRRKAAFWWRWVKVLLTVVVCFLIGGIGSEFVQSLLPYKTFQWGDILANLLGTSLGLALALHLEKRYKDSLDLTRNLFYQPVRLGTGDGGEVDDLERQLDLELESDEDEYDVANVTGGNGGGRKGLNGTVGTTVPVGGGGGGGMGKNVWEDVRSPRDGGGERDPAGPPHTAQTLFSLGDED